MAITLENWHGEEKEHLNILLSKCRKENDPHRLMDHFQALKTFLLAHLVQQNILSFQLKHGEIVEGDLEDALIEKCKGCVGDTRNVMRDLHRFLRRFENEKTVDSMDFRVGSGRIIARFDKSLTAFNDFFEHLNKAVGAS